MKISAQVVGQERLTSNLSQFPSAVRQSLVREVTKISIDLQRKVVSQKLHGQLLRQRSGRLARSINQRVVEDDLKVTGSVGTNVSYGKVHELGGTFKVPQHMRMMRQAFGRPIKEPRLVTVRAHSVTFPQRSFLQSSLDEMRNAIVSRLTAAAQKAASDLFEG
ncbi:phage virion morphogenesis protein [Limnobacter litoralis]|uniref:HK97 gp10 family phage protein n=1 Tax=Limnobacter litoralis TaxID=481366 RepID=A0ABQ5YPL8_9BURK|nr:phage virion morphogenesis protein [Limnobacter litoralis]GLR26514.1 hypothetical protein GCM10007875_16040 [Limnobacter litoralis]